MPGFSYVMIPALANEEMQELRFEEPVTLENDGFVASLKRFINPKRLMHKLLKLPCSLRDATSLACGLWSRVVGIKRRAEIHYG